MSAFFCVYFSLRWSTYDGLITRPTTVCKLQISDLILNGFSPGRQFRQREEEEKKKKVMFIGSST
jgi:hypothetical protein